ncbi:DNA damage-binding protein 1a [Dimargaris verticillata]|uniref:DNA damage-binding protein 1a n=1 Tax=Dimargaris verticillata TaxID=2761393 RepID=A0A9W8EC13_9FUNG|nr:DNA damage-binding protein 1a [Dimargaris verticillata]
MRYNYVVTAHKASSVHHALRGHFMDPQELNLIVAKNTRVEIFRPTPQGLKPGYEFEIYGRIALLKLLRPQGRSTDLLLVTTEKYKFCLLSWDSATQTVVTEASGTLNDDIGRPSDHGQMGHVDPACRAIALHLYQGSIKVLPVETPESLRQSRASTLTTTGLRLSGTGAAVPYNELASSYPYNPRYKALSSKGKKPVVSPRAGDLREAFVAHVEELNILAMAFMANSSAVPQLLVLHRDYKQNCWVKPYAISLADRELTPGPWPDYSVENGASMLIPLQTKGGALVVGEVSITYYNGPQTAHIISMKPTSIEVYDYIGTDDRRLLLGDDEGNLYVLVLLWNDKSGGLTDMKLERLGQTTIGSALVHLADGLVYIGSHYGDSMLIQLTTEAVTPGTYFRTLETFTNLAPITDFCVVDTDKQGQGQVVACSGAYKEGSLRIIRNGVGVNQQGFVPLDRVRNVWSLRPTTTNEEELLLVVGFLTETRLLTLKDNHTLCEVDQLPGLVLAAPTLAIANTHDNHVVQVTAARVRLVQLPHGGQVDEWVPPPELSITLASCNAHQVLLALRQGWVVYLGIEHGKLVEQGRRQFSTEVACLTLAVSATCSADAPAALGAVSLWSSAEVQTVLLPTLDSAAVQRITGDTLARSVLLAYFEHGLYLLVALGNGVLYYYECDAATGLLGDRKKVTLGTQPIQFTPFCTKGALHVFAASDRPTIVHSSGRKLYFAPVDAEATVGMCSFSSQRLPRSVVLAMPNGLCLGRIDDIQKLHIRTVSLPGYMARRICYHEPAGAFGVLTSLIPASSSPFSPQATAGETSTAMDVDTKASLAKPTGSPTVTSAFKVLDGPSLAVSDEFFLQQFEQAESLITAQLGADSALYFVVGTAFVKPDTADTTAGRILVFRYVTPQRRLELVAQQAVAGAVYSLAVVDGDKLAASVNNQTVVFAWTQRQDAWELTQLCVYQSHVLALYMVTRGNIIAVGDLMRSIMLLEFNPEASTLTEVARDYNTNWMTAIEALDGQAETILGAEVADNLFAVHRYRCGPTPAESSTDGTSTVSNSGPAAMVTDTDRHKLHTYARYHLGDFVNRFRHGSLVMNLADSHVVAKPTLLYGTVNGALGVIATLDKAQYELLHQLQASLSLSLPSIGHLDHVDWRAFVNTQRVVPQEGFIDGDLIEQFLDLTHSQKQDLVKGTHTGQPLGMSVDELTQIVEDLTNIY